MSDKFGGISMDDIDAAASDFSESTAESIDQKTSDQLRQQKTSSVTIQNEKQEDRKSEVVTKKTKPINVILSIAAVVIALGVVSVIVFFFGRGRQEKPDLGNDNPYITTNNVAEDGFDWTTIDSISEGFKKTQENYYQNGYIPADSLVSAITDAKAYADSLVENGVASSVQMGESGCISVQLPNGETCLYIPKIEGVMSCGSDCRIVTYEPNRDIANGIVDKTATDIAGLDAYVFNNADNIDTDEITLESLYNMKNAAIVLWHGHGCYNGVDTYLSLGEKFDRNELKKVDTDIPLFAVDTEGIVFLKQSFFEKQFASGDFNGTIIYFGACESGKAPDLANILISKGASAVFAPSDVVSVSYGGKMAKSIFKSMKDGSSAADSLLDAKQECGNRDSYLTGLNYAVDNGLEGFIDGIKLAMHPAEIKLFGNKDAGLIMNDQINNSVSNTSSNDNGTDAENTINSSDSNDIEENEDGVVRLNQYTETAHCISGDGLLFYGQNRFDNKDDKFYFICKDVEDKIPSINKSETIGIYTAFYDNELTFIPIMDDPRYTVNLNFGDIIGDGSGVYNFPKELIRHTFGGNGDFASSGLIDPGNPLTECNGKDLTDYINSRSIGFYSLFDGSDYKILEAERNEKFIFGGYVGTAYKTVDIVADKEFYLAKTNGVFTLPIERTKNGYFTVNLSDVDPGVYYIDEYDTFVRFVG